MAENRYNPTFANILSSLKVKGATLTGGSDKAGFVPVLNDNGTLNLSIIPISEIQTSLTVSPLSNIAFVNTNSTGDNTSRDGSIVSPYKTLTEAARSFSNFMLVPGNYNDEYVTFRSSDDLTVRIIGLGTTTFGNLTLSAYPLNTLFEFYNIKITGSLIFASNVSNCTVTIAGTSTINNINVNDSGETVSVRISADSKVTSFTGNGTTTVSYLASSDRVTNTSAQVSGDTVTEAIDALAVRKIKIPKFSVGSTGVLADSSDYEDVSVNIGGDTYSIVELGTTLVTAVNSLFHKDGDSPTYSTLTANTVVTDNTVTKNLKFGSLSDIKAIISVDSGNFLVIA